MILKNDIHVFFVFFPYLPTLHLSLVRPSNNKLIWCGLTASFSV